MKSNFLLRLWWPYRIAVFLPIYIVISSLAKFWIDGNGIDDLQIGLSSVIAGLPVVVLMALLLMNRGYDPDASYGPMTDEEMKHSKFIKAMGLLFLLAGSSYLFLHFQFSAEISFLKLALAVIFGFAAIVFGGILLSGRFGTGTNGIEEAA